METETPTSTIPPIPDNNSCTKVAVLTATAPGVGGGYYYSGAEGPKGPTIRIMDFPKAPKGTPGRAMRRTGSTTVGGYALLEDSYGRQYIRDHKGTIRRVKSKKA